MEHGHGASPLTRDEVVEGPNHQIRDPILIEVPSCEARTEASITGRCGDEETPRLCRATGPPPAKNDLNLTLTPELERLRLPGPDCDIIAAISVEISEGSEAVPKLRVSSRAIELQRRTATGDPLCSARGSKKEAYAP